MGLISFCVGACAGYYFRNTHLGIRLGRKFLIPSKLFCLLKNGPLTEYKLALVVRDDLNMSKGKIASQCSHASVLAYELASIYDPEVLNSWDAYGQGKVVLKTSGELQLLELEHHAKKLGLFTNVVCDAGRTEVSPGTITVLAIGPGPRYILNEVTGHLRLL